MVEKDGGKADSTYEILLLPELEGKEKILKEIVSILGEEEWISLNANAIKTMRHNGDSDPVSHNLTVKGCRIRIRRAIITEVENQLIKLNKELHGEGTKDLSTQDSFFTNKKESLLRVKRCLSPVQKKERGEIKQWLKEGVPSHGFLPF